MEDEIINEEEILNEEIHKEENNEENNEEITEEVAPNKEAEYLDRLQRLMAEFDNYRKRTEKEKADIYDRAVSSTVTELLAIIDNFERALKLDGSDKSFYEGVNMIYKQLVAAIEKVGVEPIETINQTFDPNYHNAIFHVEDENVGANTIVEEMQKGYVYKDKVIRHSLVKVAN